MPVLLFCQCGSDRVDLKLWNGNRPQVRCLTCGKEAWLDGFTVSEFDPAKLFSPSLMSDLVASWYVLALILAVPGLLCLLVSYVPVGKQENTSPAAQKHSDSFPD